MEENNNNNTNNSIKLIISQVNKLSIQDKQSFYTNLIKSSNAHECYLIQKTLTEQKKGNLNLIGLLPLDLSLLIFNYLEGDNLLNSLLTCKIWYNKLKSNSFWNRKYRGLLIRGEEDPLLQWENNNTTTDKDKDNSSNSNKLTSFRKYLTILNRTKNWSAGKPCRTSTIILPYTLDKTMLLGPKELLIMGNDREIKLLSITKRWSIINWKLPQICILLDIDWKNGLLIGCPYGRDCLIFNLYNGNILGTLIGHTSLITHGTFSNQYIITKAGDNTLKIWSKLNYSMVNSLQLDSLPLLSLKIIPNTNLLLIVNVFGFIKVLNLDSFELVQIFHPLNWTQNNIEELENNQFKHFEILDNKIILTQSTLIFFIKFDLHSKLLELIKVKLHSSIIRCISLNNLGLVIGNISYTSFNPSMLYFWNFETNECIIPIEFKPNFNFLNLKSNNNLIVLNGRTNTNTLFWLDFLPNVNFL